MITALFSLIIGLFALWFGFKFIKSYIAVKNWDKIEATVLSKKVAKHARSSTRASHGVFVEYAYVFNHQKYTNNKVYLAELSGGQVNQYKSAAEKTVNSLQDKLTIYVNPNQPKQSVIFCEGILLYIFVFVMGISASLYGLITLVSPLL